MVLIKIQEFYTNVRAYFPDARYQIKPFVVYFEFRVFGIRVELYYYWLDDVIRIYHQTCRGCSVYTYDEHSKLEWDKLPETLKQLNNAGAVALEGEI